MATILNNNNFTLTPEQQQIISNAASWAGVDTVVVQDMEENPQGDDLFEVPITDEDGQFLFGINLQTNEVIR